MKKCLLAASAICLLFVAQITAYASSSREKPDGAAACITKEEACGIAREYVAEGSKFQFAENKGDSFEVVYYNDDRQEYYQVNMDSLSGEVRSYKNWLFCRKGSKNVSFSEEEAKQLVLGEYPEAAELEVNLDYKGDYKRYLVQFTTEEAKGLCEINPESGEIIGIQIELQQ